MWLGFWSPSWHLLQKILATVLYRKFKSIWLMLSLILRVTEQHPQAWANQDQQTPSMGHTECPKNTGQLGFKNHALTLWTQQKPRRFKRQMRRWEKENAAESHFSTRFVFPHLCSKERENKFYLNFSKHFVPHFNLKGSLMFIDPRDF